MKIDWTACLLVAVLAVGATLVTWLDIPGLIGAYCALCFTLGQLYEGW